jgi:hypothetical protein
MAYVIMDVRLPSLEEVSTMPDTDNQTFQICIR